jgi:hypothetical protein
MEAWMSDTKRRMVGFLIGIALGLPYSLISEYINVWMLPGIPLFEQPVGRVTAVIATTLVIGILGLIIAWEKDSFPGLIAGALFTVAATSYLAFLNSGSTQPEKTLILFIFTFLPRMVLYFPISLFLFWIIRQIEHGAGAPLASVRGGLLVMAAALIVMAAGAGFSQLSAEARQALKDANQLTLAGISAAAQGTRLPAALEPVEGFGANAASAYTLEWSDAVDSLNVIRPVTDDPALESLIIVHFANGYEFGCVYTPPGRVPKCINITMLP